MKKLDYIVLVYGVALIGFFGLSFMAFMGDPITASLDWMAGIGIITVIVSVYGVLVLYWFKREQIKV